MQYWLMKSEPDVWSLEQQKKAGTKGATWDGVRNYQAANNLKAMKIGDLCFFYHSNIGKEIVGIVKVIKEAFSTSPKDKVKSEIDLELAGLISDDVALAVRAELMRFSDVFDTDDTKEMIYKSVTNATRDMVREGLDQNLALIAKEVINEALDK